MASTCVGPITGSAGRSRAGAGSMVAAAGAVTPCPGGTTNVVVVVAMTAPDRTSCSVTSSFEPAVTAVTFER